MRGFLVVTGLLISTLVPSLTFANIERQPCNFLCKEIPDPNEVLKAFDQPVRRELTSDVLRVLAWNVYKGRKAGFFQDFRTMAQNADLVMLSEGTDGDKVKPVLDQTLGFGWAMGISFFMKDEVATGIITGSYAVPTAVTYSRTKDLEPFSDSPKIILVSKYRHLPSQTEILVLNIHGINWVGTDVFLRQIQGVEPFLAAHRGPILFAGDFNMKKDRLAAITPVLAKYGLTRAPWINPNQEKQLDDAFLRGFAVRKAALVNEVIDHGSDHPALWLELKPVQNIARGRTKQN